VPTQPAVVTGRIAGPPHGHRLLSNWELLGLCSVVFQGSFIHSIRNRASTRISSTSTSVLVPVLLLVIVLVLVLESLNNGDKASSSGIIKCKKQYPQYASVSCKHTFETLVGHCWETFGRLVAHFLHTCWTLVGHVFDMFLTLVGHVFYMFETLSGYLLDTCWTFV
jgi:hypothetical protein